MMDIIYLVLFEHSAWWFSAVALAMTWQVTRRQKLDPWMGMLRTAFLFALAVHYDAWGLLPAVIVYSFVHARRMRKRGA